MKQENNGLTLAGEIRELVNPKEVLRKGLIPAVLYGHNVKNINLAIPFSQFMKVYNEAGENTLVNLKVEGKDPVKVLIHDIDHDVVTNAVRHIDFYQVNMTEKIEAEIPIHFIGESPAVKELGGTLVFQLDALPVKCLPADLIKSVEVDVGGLKDFDAAIHIKDIAIPPSLEVLRDKDDVIVMVSRPRAEEPVEAPAEEVSEAAVTAEGAAPAEGEPGESKKTSKGE